MDINGFTVNDWTIAGLETCITVKKPDIGLSVVFDMGYSTRASVNCENVLITHGHPDHISAVLQHANKRRTYGLKPATYYMMPHLVDGVRTILSTHASMMNEPDAFDNVKISPVSVGEEMKLPNNITAKPFPTVHAIPSQGYIVYKTTETLKKEYEGMPSQDIGKLVREGVNVKDSTTVPQVAFTGDTTFDIFLSPHNKDLLKVKLLIVEATYVENPESGGSSIEKAKSWGHAHYHEFIDNAHLFSDVGAILFIHFSDKYSPSFTEKYIAETLPDCLKGKVYLALNPKKLIG